MDKRLGFAAIASMVVAIVALVVFDTDLRARPFRGDDSPEVFSENN